MRYLLIGRGRMGQCFREAAAARGGEIEAMLGRSDVETLGRMGRAADILVDFSRPEALPELCSYARRTATPVLSGTTGCTGRDLEQLRALGAHVPVLWSANYSLGIAVLRRAAAMAAAASARRCGAMSFEEKKALAVRRKTGSASEALSSDGCRK